MMRIGAPLAKAPSAPNVPMPIPISALPEITACWVSPVPWVQTASIATPCLAKMPAPSPNWTGDESQLPHWPTATFSTSAADAVDPPAATAASITATQAPNRILMATSPLDLLRRDVYRLPFYKTPHVILVES